MFIKYRYYAKHYVTEWIFEKHSRSSTARHREIDGERPEKGKNFLSLQKIEANEFVANAKSFEFGESRVGQSAVNGVALFMHQMDSREPSNL